MLNTLAAGADAAEPVLPPLAAELTAANPIDLMPADATTEFVFRDDSPADKRASFAAMGEKSPSGKPIFGVKIQVPSRYSYSVETHWKIERALKKGDVVLARFVARARQAKQESGEGAITFTLQQASAPWEKSVSVPVSPGPEWTAYDIPFTIVRDYGPQEAGTYLSFGSLQQTLEIADLQVLDFEKQVKVQQLPFTKFSYAGREEGAAWRTEALKRIETIRTAPITVHVVDATGKPVAGAKVNVDMTQSEFLFGSEVDADYLQATGPDADRYRRTITELFNTATIGNGLKWGQWINPARRKNTLASLDWLNAQHIRARGHNLVWPGWNFSPKVVKDEPDKAGNLDGIIESHIREEVTAVRGKVICWDVVNEPIHETDYFKFVPRENMAKWYQLARESDPNAQMVLNEYAMLNGPESPAMIRNFLDLVRLLQGHDAKIDALGVQGHIGALPRSPKAVLSDLDELATAGLPIQITEFDMTTHDEQLQADYTRDFLIACYSHPSVSGFVMWGFYEPKHWRPDAAMFRKDWSEKPNAKVWRDLVLGQWKTKIDAMTSAAGVFEGRGHRGTYHATATLDGKTSEADFALAKDGATVELVLKK